MMNELKADWYTLYLKALSNLNCSLSGKKTEHKAYKKNAR
jgi:hypothetical protein